MKRITVLPPALTCPTKLSPSLKLRRINLRSWKLWRTSLALVAVIAALCAGPAWAWNFIHITDLHVGEDPNGVAFEKMVNYIKTLSPRPHFVLATGDLLTNGMKPDGTVNTADWQSLTRSIIKHPTKNMWYLERTGSAPYFYNIPIYFTPGNHDYRSFLKTFSLAGYDQYIYNPKTPDGCTPGIGDAARDYYFVNYGALMVSLNSGMDNGFNTSYPHSDGLKNAQRDFLNLAVKNNPSVKSIIIFMHHSAVDNQNNGLIDNNRTVFLDSLDKWSTRFKVLVLHGHIHADAQLGRNGNPWISGPLFVRTASAKGDWYRKIDVDQAAGTINVYASALTTNPQPSSQIVTPGNGTNVGGASVLIVATLSSPAGIKSATATVNGTSLGTKTTGPWQWLWDLFGWKATNFNITVTVTDNNNNVSTSTVNVIKGAQTYYNKMNVGGTVGVVDPKDGHTAACVLTSIEVVGGYRVVNLSVDGLNHQVRAGSMMRVNNGVSGLFIYPATIFDGTERFSEIMIAPYQYPSLDILTPAPNISTNNCIVLVTTNYSGKNVPWNGIGNPPENAEQLKSLSFNNSAAQYAESYTWIMAAPNGQKTMTVNLTDKLGATVSKSVTVNYNSSLPFLAYTGPYGDYYNGFSIGTSYVDPSRVYVDIGYWRSEIGLGRSDASERECWGNQTSRDRAIEFMISCIVNTVNSGFSYCLPVGSTPVFIVDKNQYLNSSINLNPYGTITYKEIYDLAAGRLGRDSNGKYRIWASTSKATRSSADAIVDALPPAIAITSPINHTYVNTTTINVTGTASDDYLLSKVEVSINGGAYSLATGTASWNKSVTLTVNQVNTITARATDSYGKTTTASISVTCDLTAGSIAIVSPAVDGIVYCRTMPVSGTASDGGGVSKVEVRMNNGPWRTAPWVSGSATIWRRDVNFAPGLNTIEARVTDVAGNFASTTHVATYSTTGSAPAIPALSPATVSAYTGSCWTGGSGSASYDLGKNGVYTISASILAQGNASASYATSTTYISASLDQINWVTIASGTVTNYNPNWNWGSISSGPFFGRYLLVQTSIKTGGNDLYCYAGMITATGYASGFVVSNACLAPLTDMTNPVLSISSPAAGAMVGSAALTVTGTATDNVGVWGVKVCVNNGSWVTASGTNPWSANLTLVTGTNNIEVRAYDTTGNMATANRQVIYSEGCLVGYWKLDAVMGAIATDNSGNDNQGTLVNGPTWVAGQVGNALSFNGTNQRVDVTNSATLNPQYLTISAWIKPNSLGNRGIVRKNSAYAFSIYNGTLQFAPGNDWRFLNSGYAPPINVWTHVAATWDGANARIYANGALVGTLNFNDGTLPSNANPVRIGYDDNGWYFAGLIDEARIYNKALTVDEIQALHMQSSLAASWKLDETSGTTAYDVSGYGNHGTLNLMDPATDWVTGKYGKALDFDGSNDYVNVGNPASLKITGSQTIAMWIYPHGFTARRNPYNKAYGGEGTITVETTGKVNYYYGTYGGNSSPYQGFTMNRACTANVWTHLAIVRDLTSMKLRWYKNGVKTDSVTALYAAATASANNVTIGYGYAGYFDGLIDELRVYNSALSAAEITAIYNNTKTGDETSDETTNEYSELEMTKPVEPKATQLIHCAPNPFTGQTTISFQLSTPAQVSLKVYNITGQVVKTLVNECLRPGYHSVRWDGKNEHGNKVAAGVYLYRMQAGDYTKTNKMTVLR